MKNNYVECRVAHSAGGGEKVMLNILKRGVSLSAMGGVLATTPMMVAGALGLSVATGAAAQAQDGREVIVVTTARRREESVQSVPIAVTALSPELLENAQVTEFADLAASVPGLVIVNGNGAARTTPSFSIRGLSQQDLTILSDQSVLAYTGDIVAARPQGLNQTMFDLAAVEVLKGPQGTLFGRNSTGGAIIIRPNRPSDVLEGEVGLRVGNLGRRDVDFMLNVPLGDAAAFRIAGLSTQSDGYVRDVILNRMLNDDNSRALRASLLVEPNDNISSNTVFNIYNEETNGTGMITYDYNEASGLNNPLARTPRNYAEFGALEALQAGRDYYTFASGVPSFTKVDTWDLANTTEFQVNDAITIRNILGYRSTRSHNLTDTDGTPLTLLEIERINDFEQWSEEFQILGEHGILEWIVGGYYFHEEGSDQGLSNTLAVDPGDLQPATTFAYPNWSNTWSMGENTSYAVFAQGTFDLGAWIPGLSTTIGIRQNWDEREAIIMNRTAGACRFTIDHDNNPATPEIPATVNPYPDPGQCALPLSEDFSEPTWTIGLEYQATDDVMLYLAHRRGYRTGGFGARASTEQGLRRTFTPEIVDDIELGIKADWHFGDALLRTNAAAFYADYADIQRLLTDPTTTPVTTVTTNAGQATIQGFELEVLFQPNELVTIAAFWSHLDASFDEFIAPDLTDLSGNPFARAPEDTLSFSGDFILPIIDPMRGEISVGGTYYHNSGFSGNDNFDPRQTVPSFDLVNLRAGWDNFMGSPVDVGLFVNNATDEEYSFVGLGLFNALAFNSSVPQEPRTYGVTLRYHFGQE